MSRVFLSYSRKDEDFATHVRKRLETEAPDVSLWQDRTRLEGGVGWWQQVKDAIDRVEFMVLVMSEATVHSETVRKEWRYARQQGVCVYPVQAAPFDFTGLPRWMSSRAYNSSKRSIDLNRPSASGAPENIFKSHKARPGRQTVLEEDGRSEPRRVRRPSRPGPAEPQAG